MSGYENYDLKSRVYDKTRSAVGSEIIMKLLSESTIPVDRQVLLDAGCGTGLYTAAMIDEFKRIESVDLNAGMLGVAKSRMKLDVESGRIRFYQASIMSLPFSDRSVNAIMVNQVLHHLPDDFDIGWSGHERVFREFARVLKSRGLLIINSCSPEQIEEGFWFYKLIPDALEKVRGKVIALDTLDDLLLKCGFSDIQREIPLNVVLQGDSYCYAEGILDPEWRGGDSIWSLVPKDVLVNVITTGKELLEKGELLTYMRHQDRSRANTGQVTFTCVRKSN